MCLNWNVFFYDLRVLARKLASPFGHPTQVSTQVQLAATCDSLFLSLSRRRSNKRASEGARLGWAKNWGEVGRGWGEKESRFLHSPHRLPLLLIFRTSSQFRSLRASVWKRPLHRVPLATYSNSVWPGFKGFGEHEPRRLSFRSSFGMIASIT